ncbi:diguanylate cyclase [Bryobacterales bacterium F-183]|nr:diguanylate cyclase [Bryobacterales bacterium F-183]
MITGLHHVTAIASDPQKNLDFYTKFLGLRLVKKTVNFDDPGTYHFYFGDEAGSPGTILTFFPWPGSFRGRKGNGQTVRTAYTVPKNSLGEWVDKARKAGVAVEGPQVRLNEEFVTLTDPDGMLIELFATGEHEKGLGKFHSVTLAETNLDLTAGVVGGLLGWNKVAEEGNRVRYASSLEGFVDIEAVPGGLRGTSGAGTVHHIAFRTPDDAAQAEWRRKIEHAGLHVSPVMDRNYFHSIYFREPGGVLFEIATDPPGFTVDEPLAELGQNLKLPAQYESMRGRIESVLPKVTV